MDLDPGATIGSYSIEGRLGNGGMAVVYLVRHGRLGTLHALKVLGMPFGPVQERLLQEGRVQASLKHPNIVTVTDVVDVHGAPGLILEYVRGPTLAELVREVPLSRAQQDLVACGILAGVSAAHAAGLVHRDLKPGNILLQIGEAGLIPKVTDFGLAKLLDSDDADSPTLSGHAVGTPAYMAPEQVRNAKHVDQRADVFSLGAVLFELVSRKRAFEGPDNFEIYRRVCTGSRSPIAEVEPDLPERMVRAIEGALAVNPDERIESCDHLFDTWTDGQSSAAGAGPWDDSTLSLAQQTIPSLTAHAVPIDLTGTPLAALYARPSDVTVTVPVPVRANGQEWRWLLIPGMTTVLLLAGFVWWLPSHEPSPATVSSPTESAVAGSKVTAPPALAPVRTPKPARENAVAKPDPAPDVPNVPVAKVVSRPMRVERTTPPVESVASAVPEPTGTVLVEGDATGVQLVRDGRRFAAGNAVPAGVYELLVQFSDDPPVGAGQLVVFESRTTTVWCDAAFYRCRVR